MKKVKVYWPKKYANKSSGVLGVHSLEDLMKRLKGWTYTVSDSSSSKEYDWVVTNVSKKKCDCG